MDIFQISKDTIFTRFALAFIVSVFGIVICFFIGSNDKIDHTEFNQLTKVELKDVTWSKSDDGYEINGISNSSEKIKAIGHQKPAAKGSKITVYINESADIDEDNMNIRKYYVSQKDFISQKKKSNESSKAYVNFLTKQMPVAIVIIAIFLALIGADDFFRV